MTKLVLGTEQKRYPPESTGLIKSFSMPQAEESLEQDANVQEEGEIVETEEGVVKDSATEEAESHPEQEVKEVPKEDKPTERPVYTMPVAKAQEEKRRAVEKARAEAKAEAEKDLLALKASYENKQSEVDQGVWQQDLRKVAEKHGMEFEALTDVFGVFQKSLPDLSKYDQVIKEKEIEGHKILVEREVDEKVAPLLLKDYPQATPEHIRSVKERIAELAFTQEFNTYRVEDIYKVNQEQFVFNNSISAESSGGRATEFVDFTKMTDEEEIELADRDPEAYRKYVKWSVANDSKFLD